MQLKEFSLFVPVIESGTVLKALEAAIPSSVVDKAIIDTKAVEERKRALPSPAGSLFSYCHEFLVKSFNENGAEKSG